jgi:hypothetical protein
MKRTEDQVPASGRIGWEGALSSTALILLLLNAGVESWFGHVPVFSLITGLTAIASGVISIGISYLEGAGWLGVLLPIGWVAAGLWTLLH